MLNFVARRLAQLVLVVLGVSTVVFLVLRLTGDPVALMLPVEATAQEVAAMRKALGFDAPLYVQYARFLLDLLHGRLGDSLRYGQPALGLVLERLPATLELAGSAQGFALLLAIPVGTLSATRRDSIFDNAGSLLALIGQAMPVFWLGMILIVAFSVQRHWLPAFGRGGIEHLILPAITLGMHGAAMTSRLLRSAMLEVLNSDYLRTARAKGVAEYRVVMKHAFKNALLPVITVIGLQFAHLLSGSVVTETVFAWPGVGRLIVQAISNRDYPLVQAGVLVMAFIFVLANLMVDIAYAYIDPRVSVN